MIFYIEVLKNQKIIYKYTEEKQMRTAPKKIKRYKLSNLYIFFCSLISPIYMRIVPLVRRYKLEAFQCQEIPKGQVIFAVNHSNIHDVPMIWSILRRHVFVLAGDEPRGDSNGIALAVNGVIWVKRDQKESKHDAKRNMMRLLEKGKSLLIFPEATWNLTPAKPMLPLHWGIIELAQKTGVPIVPVTLEYTEKKSCRYSIGNAMYISEQDEKSEMIIRLQDEMATMRWEAWETFAQYKRKNLSIKDFERYTKERLEEYPKLDVEFERTTILQK